MNSIYTVLTRWHGRVIQPRIQKHCGPGQKNFVIRAILRAAFWFTVILAYTLLSLFPLVWSGITIIGYNIGMALANAYPVIPQGVALSLALLPSAAMLVWFTYHSVKPAMKCVVGWFRLVHVK
jgi:hypothetical protein